MNEKHYDYSVGLDAPYWIQELRTTKGKLVWSFSVPRELSFFMVFGLVLVLIFSVSQVVALPTWLWLLLYVFIPYRLAHLYCEFEPDGKRMHIFLIDAINFLLKFSLDKRGIYQGERTKEHRESMVFEKINL